MSLRGAIVDKNLEDGWEFDREGRVITLSQNAKLLFENEANQLEFRLNERHTKHLEDLTNFPEKSDGSIDETNSTSDSTKNEKETKR